MSMKNNKSVFWSIEPLERDAKIKVQFLEKEYRWQYEYDFSASELLDGESRHEIMFKLGRFFHSDHNLRQTLKRLEENIRKKQKISWQENCDSKSCHNIHIIKDPFWAVVELLIKIKRILCRIRI